MLHVKRVGMILVIFVGMLFVSILISMPFYFRDMKEINHSLQKGAKKIDSPSGTIEYLDIGEGKPILLSHGTMGGHDHGLLMANKLIGEGYRLIIPSRFGYLNSEMPEDANFERQADCYDFLTDQLGLNEVIVTGMSAGSVPATMFAIKYPEKTAGLILVSSITYVPKDMLEPQALPIPVFVYDTVLNSDYLFWIIYKLSPTTINNLFGASDNLTSQIDIDEQKFVSDISKTFLPVSKRYTGWVNDSKNISQLVRMPLEKIKVPTLIISAKDDSLAPYSWSRYLSDNILGSQFVSFESGGHVLLGNTKEVKDSFEKFIYTVYGGDKGNGSGRES